METNDFDLVQRLKTSPLFVTPQHISSPQACDYIQPIFVQTSGGIPQVSIQQSSKSNKLIRSTETAAVGYHQILEK